MKIQSIEVFSDFSLRVEKTANIENLAKNLAEKKSIVAECILFDSCLSDLKHISLAFKIGDTVLNVGDEILGVEVCCEMLNFELCTKDFKPYNTKTFILNDNQTYSEFYKYIYITLGLLSEKLKIDLPLELDIVTNSEEVFEKIAEKAKLKEDCQIKNLGRVKHVYNLWIS